MNKPGQPGRANTQRDGHALKGRRPASAVLKACGGPGPILRRARRALAEGWNQLVLELTDLILGARPKNGAARQMRRAALERLAARATNGVEQNIYRGAAAALRDGRPTPTKTHDRAASIFNDKQTEK